MWKIMYKFTCRKTRKKRVRKIHTGKSREAQFFPDPDSYFPAFLFALST